MRVVGVARWAVGCIVLFAAGLAVAATAIQIDFAEVNGPSVSVPPFPALNVAQVTPPVSLPAGERIASATISGYWGSVDYPFSTAPVDVFLDGVLVAQCLPSDPCAVDASGQRGWSHTFTAGELLQLQPENPAFTVAQKDKFRVRLGASTLILETAPVQVVPTLSPLGLVALLAAMAAAGAFVLRRFPRR